jgi:uncharacterized protein YfaS (alpha-2-macroglobulin family)
VAKEYLKGTRVGIKVRFKDVNGQPADPTAVTFYVRDPAGVLTPHVYPADLDTWKTEGVVGEYWFRLTPATKGKWSVEAEGTGAVQATGETTFTVKASATRP